jgi:HlyD family secretion protein
MSNNDEKIIVPDEATKPGTRKLTIAEENYVFINNGGVAEKRLVKTGISDDKRQEIFSGIKAGEAVIVGPYKILRHLVAGDKIKAGAKQQ